METNTATATELLALLICDDGTMAVVDITSDSLAGLRRALDCRLVDVVQLPNGADCWVDDEGFYGGLGLNMIASKMCGRKIMGHAVLTGFDFNTGETTGFTARMCKRLAAGGQLLGPAFSLDEVDESRESGSWWLDGKSLV